MSAVFVFAGRPAAVRIASLLPATTDWVRAFGASDQLVACSHECNVPPEMAEEVPVVTRATYTAEADSRAIDDAVREQLDAGLSLYDVDVERLRAQRPDVILTQTQCEVCAVSRSQLDAALAEWDTDGGQAPQLFSLAPATLKAVFDTGLTLGRTVGRLDAAMSFLAKGEQRLRALRDTLGLSQPPGSKPPGSKRTDPAAPPTVACVEWLDPFMTAGHWTPGLVEQAGGRAVLSEEGARSRTVEWEALRAADPDVLAIMPCGFALEETLRDLPALTERPGWAELRAVHEGRVFLFDGDVYFNRPGPRLYRSIELLAAALHPERGGTVVEPKPWEMQPLETRSHDVR